jgi:hypothetical protein
MRCLPNFSFAICNPKIKSRLRVCLSAFVPSWLLLAATSLAATPVLTRITPPVAQRGTEVDVVFEGSRLADAQEALLYEPGITITKIEPSKDPKTADKQVKAHLKISKDAALGEHSLRLRTATGISDLRTFQITPYPVIDEKEPNSDFKQPQKLPLNVTVFGTITSEDVDYFVVEAKKGQRLTAEVVGMRMGGVLFDPYLAILDLNRFEIASSDDTTLHLQDPFISMIAPRDGQYIVMVRESSYGGDANARYLLHIGNFPRPTVVTPPGAQAGEEVKLTFLGDPAGPITQNLKLPNSAEAKFPVYAEQNGLVSPSPNYIRISPFPSVSEVEPNNDPKTATPISISAPFAINGVISTSEDSDFFKFHAKKGQTLEFRVHARDLRSPLDSVLSVTDEKGKQLGYNDDAGSPDSYLRAAIPADGDYLIRMRDHLRGGSPEHLYRVEVTPAEPTLALTLVKVNQNQASQERHAIAIPRNGYMGTVLRATRANFSAELQVLADNLPAGVTMHVGPLAANASEFAVLFQAKADAPLSERLVKLTAKSIDPKHPVQADFEQSVEMVPGPNNTSYYSVDIDRLALAVVDELPFSVSIEATKAPLPQSGELVLKIKATRKADFKGPITVKLLQPPTGISAKNSVTIPSDKSEALLPLSASADAAAHPVTLSLLATADVKGPAYACSPPVQLDIVPAYSKGKLIAAHVEQGQSTQIICELEQKTPFQGKAKAKLKGLPANVTANDVEFSSSDKAITFTVTTTPKALPTQYKTLYVQATLEQSGQPILQNLAQGGLLRIDRPATPKLASTKGPQK